MGGKRKRKGGGGGRRGKKTEKLMKHKINVLKKREIHMNGTNLLREDEDFFDFLLLLCFRLLLLPIFFERLSFLLRFFRLEELREDPPAPPPSSLSLPPPPPPPSPLSPSPSLSEELTPSCHKRRASASQA